MKWAMARLRPRKVGEHGLALRRAGPRPPCVRNHPTSSELRTKVFVSCMKPPTAMRRGTRCDPALERRRSAEDRRTLVDRARTLFSSGRTRPNDGLPEAVASRSSAWAGPKVRSTTDPVFEAEAMQACTRALCDRRRAAWRCPAPLAATRPWRCASTSSRRRDEEPASARPTASAASLIPHRPRRPISGDRSPREVARRARRAARAVSARD